MRPSAIIPALCCTVALILSFLCLFAGHKKSFMEDYHLLTLNTSRLGQNLLTDNPSDSNPLNNLLNSLPDLPDQLTDGINSAIGEVTERLGIEDWYSAHLLDYCFGQYAPDEAPNATLPLSDISKNVTGCSNQTAMFYFDPTKIVEQALNNSGLDISLDDIEWPADIQRGIDAIRLVSVTAFVLYCISIGLIFFALVGTLAATFLAGRLTACLNVMVAILAFLAIGLASALTTAAVVKGVDIINQYGRDIGIDAVRGGKFMALTWSATTLMLITVAYWCFETCFGARRRRRHDSYVAKHG